jgi:small subunit ribosomal protein S14
MAKKSKIARNKQRQEVVDRYAAKRLELKKQLVDPTSTDEQREEARVGLQKLPRNASPVRLHISIGCYLDFQIRLDVL